MIGFMPTYNLFLISLILDQNPKLDAKCNTIHHLNICALMIMQPNTTKGYLCDLHQLCCQRCIITAI